MTEINVKVIRARGRAIIDGKPMPDGSYASLTVLLGFNIPDLCDAYEAQAKEIERLTDLFRCTRDAGLERVRDIERLKGLLLEAHPIISQQIDECSNPECEWCSDARALSTKIAKELES